MKYIKQFSVILLISFIGELLSTAIPLPIPAGIYGILLLFIALKTRLLPLSAVRETGLFLVAIMQILFIPSTVGLMSVWPVFTQKWVAYTVIIVLTTFAVMLVSGKVTQAVIRRSAKPTGKDTGKIGGDGHA